MYCAVYNLAFGGPKNSAKKGNESKRSAFYFEILWYTRVYCSFFISMSCPSRTCIANTYNGIARGGYSTMMNVQCPPKPYWERAGVTVTALSTQRCLPSSAPVQHKLVLISICSITLLIILVVPKLCILIINKSLDKVYVTVKMKNSQGIKPELTRARTNF